MSNNNNTTATTSADSTASIPATANTMKDSIFGFLPLVLVFGVFYFFVIRPQAKKQKMHDELVKSIQKGDKVVAAGGIMGEIVKIKDDKSVILGVGHKIEIEVLRSSVISVVDKKAATSK